MLLFQTRELEPPLDAMKCTLSTSDFWWVFLGFTPWRCVWWDSSNHVMKWRRSLPLGLLEKSQLLSELRWLRCCIHSTAQLRTAHKKPSWKHGQLFFRWDSLLKSSKIQKEKHNMFTVGSLLMLDWPFAVTVLLLVVLLVVVAIIVVAAAVVLLLSLLLTSRSSCDNSEKTVGSFQVCFQGFCVLFWRFISPKLGEWPALRRLTSARTHLGA